MAIVTMSASAQVQLRSTFLQMTHLLTPYWTPVRRQTTPVWIILHTVESPQPVLPGSPPPTTHWDHSSRRLNTSHPSPSQWKQRRLMSQCWPSRDSPSPSCHVTFINTNQRGEMMATPRNKGRTTSCRTINFFLSPALLAEWKKHL